MNKMVIIPTKWIIIPEKEKLFHELATHVEVDDEAGGAFIKVRQIRSDDDPYIRLDPCEIDAFVKTLAMALSVCNELNNKDD